MRIKIVIMLCIFVLSMIFSSCSKQEKNNISDNNIKVGELTITEVLQLSKKKDSLSIEDFNIESKETTKEDNLLNSIYKVNYRGVEYELQVSYYINNNTFHSVELIHELSGDSIDIRYNRVEDFFNNHMSMSRYITYNLPETLINGDYNVELGYLGGNLFCYKEIGSCIISETSESTPYGWNSYGGVEMYYKLNCIFNNGQLIDVSIPWNHSVYLDEAQPVDGCEVPAIIIPVSHDLYTAVEAEEKGLTQDEITSKMWYVFFAKEDSDISYAIYFNKDYYSMEDTISLAQTVRFSEDAFNIVIQ